MAGSRVGSLALKIRAPADRLPALAGASEAFAASVLRRCDEVLESRAPGRVVLLSRLDLSLRLLEGALSHEGEVDAFAREIAREIERRADAATETPSGEPPIAVFEDEVAWRAAHLEMRAREPGPSRWPFEALEADGEPMATLVDGDRQPLLLEVLVRLLERGTLLGVLTALPGDVVELLAKAIGARAPARASESPLRLPPALQAFASRWPPALPFALARLAAAVAARAHLGRSASEGEAVSLAGATLAAILPRLAPGGDAPSLRAGDPRAPESGAPADARPAVEAGLSTAFGGLFYLLPLALELGLGELLWHACLPEGAVLSAATALLVGHGGETIARDPAPGLFGGVREGEPCPGVLPEQQEEIATALLSSVVDALPRRDLATLSEPFIRLHDTADGRLLIASARESAFLLFAFAAPAADETVRALETFLARWPASAPAPRSGVALAGLDRRARVRPLRESPGVSPLVPIAGDLPARALVAQIAGTLAHLFAARIGMPPPWRPADLAARLSIPARIVSTDDALEIEIPMERIDLDVRRAGLDADPGRVAWLDKSVRFVFVDGEGEDA